MHKSASITSNASLKSLGEKYPAQRRLLLLRTCSTLPHLCLCPCQTSPFLSSRVTSTLLCSAFDPRLETGLPALPASQKAKLSWTWGSWRHRTTAGVKHSQWSQLMTFDEIRINDSISQYFSSFAISIQFCKKHPCNFRFSTLTIWEFPPSLFTKKLSKSEGKGVKF